MEKVKPMEATSEPESIVELKKTAAEITEEKMIPIEDAPPEPLEEQPIQPKETQTETAEPKTDSTETGTEGDKEPAEEIKREVKHEPEPEMEINTKASVKPFDGSKVEKVSKRKVVKKKTKGEEQKEVPKQREEKTTETDLPEKSNEEEPKKASHVTAIENIVTEARDTFVEGNSSRATEIKKPDQEIKSKPLSEDLQAVKSREEKVSKKKVVKKNTETKTEERKEVPILDKKSKSEAVRETTEDSPEQESNDVIMNNEAEKVVEVDSSNAIESKTPNKEIESKPQSEDSKVHELKEEHVVKDLEKDGKPEPKIETTEAKEETETEKGNTETEFGDSKPTQEGGDVEKDSPEVVNVKTKTQEPEPEKEITGKSKEGKVSKKKVLKKKTNKVEEQKTEAEPTVETTTAKEESLGTEREKSNSEVRDSEPSQERIERVEEAKTQGKVSKKKTVKKKSIKTEEQKVEPEETFEKDSKPETTEDKPNVTHTEKIEAEVIDSKSRNEEIEKVKGEVKTETDLQPKHDTEDLKNPAGESEARDQTKISDLETSEETVANTVGETESEEKPTDAPIENKESRESKPTEATRPIEGEELTDTVEVKKKKKVKTVKKKKKSSETESEKELLKKDSDSQLSPIKRGLKVLKSIVDSDRDMTALDEVAELEDFSSAEVQMGFLRLAKRVSNPIIVEEMVSDELSKEAARGDSPLLGFKILTNVVQKNPYSVSSVESFLSPEDFSPAVVHAEKAYVARIVKEVNSPVVKEEMLERMERKTSEMRTELANLVVESQESRNVSEDQPLDLVEILPPLDNIPAQAALLGLATEVSSLVEVYQGLALEIIKPRKILPVLGSVAVQHVRGNLPLVKEELASLVKEQVFNPEKQKKNQIIWENVAAFLQSPRVSTEFVVNDGSRSREGLCTALRSLVSSIQEQTEAENQLLFSQPENIPPALKSLEAQVLMSTVTERLVQAPVIERVLSQGITSDNADSLPYFGFQALKTVVENPTLTVEISDELVEVEKLSQDLISTKLGQVLSTAHCIREKVSDCWIDLCHCVTVIL